jgi:hypothetical protein
MNKMHYTVIAAALTLSNVALADEPPLQPLPPAQPSQDGVKIEEVPPAEPQPPVVQPAAAPAEQPKPPPPTKSIPISLRTDGGYGIRSLEKLPVTGADVGLAIGAQPAKHFAVYGALRGFFGSTEGGLAVKALRVSVDMDIVIDRFRIGFDPGMFWVGVDRVTKDQTIVGWGPKLGVSLRLDLFRSDPFAFFFRAAADAGATFADGSMFGGVLLGGGIDFDIKPGDRSTL